MIFHILKEGEVLEPYLNFGWIEGPVFKYKTSRYLWCLRIRLNPFKIFQWSIIL